MIFRKSFLTIITSMVILFNVVASIAGETNSYNPNIITVETVPTTFKDVSANNWAIKPITYMVEKGVLKGYPNNFFKPNSNISREEFATIMVKGLKLLSNNENNQTFKDVDQTRWSFNYIENAKEYLTGYKLDDELYFRPKELAVREDMAVALVKSLDLENSDFNPAILDNVSDNYKISKYLRNYIAIAIDNKIMNGYPIDRDGNKLFKPSGKLTRAEAASLLFNALKLKGLVPYEYLGFEKVVISEVLKDNKNATYEMENNNNITERFKGTLYLSKNPYSNNKENVDFLILKTQHTKYILTGSTKGLDLLHKKNILVNGYIKDYTILESYPTLHIESYKEIDNMSNSSDIYTTYSNQPIYLINGNTKIEEKPSKSEIFIKWQEGVTASVIATIETTGLTPSKYEFLLIEFLEVHNDFIKGYFKIKINGKIVADNIPGKIYGYNQNIGDYFKFYSGGEAADKWHFSGYITSKSSVEKLPK